MYTRLVEGVEPPDGNREVLALVARVVGQHSGEERCPRFVALVGTNGRLSRLIRTDSEDEFVHITLGLIDLGFRKCVTTTVNSLAFDSVYRLRL
ncbi:MAG: hypothetical protein V4792_04365 [Pseudomonadota bacterium]